MKRKTMRSILALLLLLIPVLAAGRAEQAEPVTQTVQLPGSPWAVSIPKEMRYDGPRNGDGTGHNVRVYRQESFVLLFVFSNLQS